LLIGIALTGASSALAQVGAGGTFSLRDKSGLEHVLVLRSPGDDFSTGSDLYLPDLLWHACRPSEMRAFSGLRLAIEPVMHG
jgi:hypothetical protein